ncbi:hypothetical protein C4559_01195 [Candidatus Microgenomates bacterium]|nr:MAG: hypothetical protein C4559_01195 [Candidatus Microgenomates bacterium]
MKKTFLVTLIFLFFVLSYKPSFAQEAIASESSSYQLPYSGLLPDSPLYFLKVIRDRIVGYMISDPLKKAEFDLLQADKRLTGGILVFSKGEEDLGITTISKGENYLEESIIKTKEAKKQGMETAGFSGKLSASIKKHKEVLKELKTKASANKRENFVIIEKKLVGLEKEVNGVLLK